MPKRALIIFLKYPEAGKVKTRLAGRIGDRKAARVYKMMAEDVIAAAGKVSAQAVRIFCYFSPAEKEREIRSWLSGKIECENLAQYGADLGRRMSNAFRDVFQRGLDRACIIGTDCPGTNSDVISQAFDALEGTDVVIGPAHDGGYYLLGLRNRCDEIFAGVPWSTRWVFSRTLAKIEKLGLSCRKLTELADIDSLEDLEKSRYVKIL